MNAPALLATYQLRQLEFLLRISRAMTSRLDLPSLLELILNSAAEMVGCRIGLIVLEEENRGLRPSHNAAPRYQIRAVHGITQPMLRAFEPLLDVAPLVQENTVDESVDAQLELHFRDLPARVRQVEERLGAALGQVVGLPLLVEQTLLGIIYLFRREYAFTQIDWQFLQGFADQAAIAVRNARLYQQLANERTQLATIIENNANGVMILDAERQVLVMNQALALLVGMDPATAVGKHCQDVLALRNASGDNLCQDEEFTDFSGRAKLHCEGDLNPPGSKRLTVAVNFTPLYDERKRLVNIIVNVDDITRFREDEEVKNTFTSIISHELKTPVALIKGYAQTLARPDASWDAETARQSLQIIEEEADRLERLINNLLDVSRIQAGGLKLDFAEVDMLPLVSKVVKAYRTQTETHELTVDFSQPLPPVWGDEERLRQVLTNLIGNAIKYSPEGGAIRVGGWLEQAEGSPRVVLFVADQGIGIPQEEIAKIFDRYYRVDSTLRRSTAGTGLGLFLSKAIVDAHGGQIWARSEPGKGATFFIALPARD